MYLDMKYEKEMGLLITTSIVTSGCLEGES